jgi:F-type H+-transporting ATPase subunit delta
MTSKTAAIRYARALFEVALRENADLDRIEQELAGFEDLFKQQPALKKVMLNPAVPVPRKRAAMVDLTAYAQTSPIVTKLLVLLAERDRLIVLPDLLASYRDRLSSHRNVVRAEVTTSTPLAKGAADAIQQRLAQVTGRTVSMQTRVDPAIVGGLVAKVGSTVYDASVTRQLEKIRDRLVEGI